MKSFTVSVRFETVDAETPLEAAKEIAKWLLVDADTFVYDVMDEETQNNVTVDLSEEDEDAVLPN